MRRMSFAATERQLLAGQKTVTRRQGWSTLKAGDELLAVRKCMGLRRGEKQHVLCKVRVISVRREPLAACTTQEEVDREGFTDMVPAEFRKFFRLLNNLDDDSTEVTRIEFEVVA